MLTGDLWDMFASTATFEDIARQDVVVIWRQVGELRSAEPDDIEMTDWEIAEALKEYARRGL